VVHHASRTILRKEPRPLAGVLLAGAIGLMSNIACFAAVILTLREH